jgi:hypothetical protein
MVYTATAFGVPFLDYIVDRYGRNVIYLSGDLGHQILPSMVPGKSLRSTDELAAYFVERDAIWEIDHAARLCGLTPDEIKGGIADTASGYPESDPSRKYVHLQVLERALGWLLEGEDRNRCWFWCCTPFSSLPFFDRVMRISPREKRNRLLYRRFLSHLSPETAAIPDVNRGLPVRSPLYPYRMAAVSALERAPRMLAAVKRLIGRRPASVPETLIARLREEVKHDHFPDDVIDRDYLIHLLQARGSLNRLSAHHLLTIATAVALHRTGSGYSEPDGSSSLLG